MFSGALSSWGRLVGRGREAPGGEERRVWVRHPCTLETTLRPAGDSGARDTLAARVTDVSHGGVHLVVGRPFEPGELLGVELPGADGEASSTVLACVVRVEPRGEGEWSVGCTFAAELGDDDLGLFGARRARPGGPDRRGWVRFPCRARAALQPAREPSAEARPARVRDLSAGGVGLQVADPVGVGELLNLELRGGDGQVVVTVLASVVRVDVRAGGERLLGCNFIGELSDRQVRALI